MIATLPERAAKPSVGGLAWRWLPTRMRVLYIATRQRTGGWLAEAFAADSATQVELEQAVGMAAGLARLRDELFDAVLVSHQPDELNALDLIEGYRAGGAEEPIVVLGMQSEQEMAALCYEVGADGYLCVPTATTRNLIWVIARAVERHRLERENQRLGQAEQARVLREQEEAAHLLRQQQTLLEEQPAGEGKAPDRPLPLECLPEELVAHYRELLRTYVIMGSGNLADELRRLAAALVAANLSAGQIIALHLHALADLIHGLGTRSTRHVMNRADLLAMELLLNVADGFRSRYLERINPAVQQQLPGFN